MLKPSMQDLMKRVNNRYLLVNLAAQRARDISVTEDETAEIHLDEKPVKVALDEICDGMIEYRQGPKPQPEPEIDMLAAAMDTDNSEADDLLSDEEADSEEDELADEALEDL
ncbi:MAG: DNA-directed RNA polymerase subunit omega [Clostridia bacterium]|nr:DNA-directed RNA polymerase subunit omega [Clostridia bacterium]